MRWLRPPAIALILISIAAAANAQQFRDPLFGLDLTAPAAGFDPLPDDILAQCPGLESECWRRRGWVFAQLSSARGTFMVVGGLFLPRDAAKASVPDDVGAFLRVSSDGCTLFGPAIEPFESPDAYSDVLDAAVLDALAHDIGRRYTKAFGGAAALSAAARARGVRTNRLPPVLARVLNGAR